MAAARFHTTSADDIREGKTTDIYFVRALQVLKAKGLDKQSGVAEFTVGKLPLDWPWGILCGLEEVVALLEGIPVDVAAVPEGTLFPARDTTGVRVPVMMIEGPYGHFCLHETPLLGFLCQATGVATKAARIRCAAPAAEILSFGTRRMHPAIAPMLSRAAYIGGCDAVSSVIGAQAMGKEPRGTMPHSLIVSFRDQRAAWKAFDEVIPASVPRIALVDTYSDEKEEALQAAELLGRGHLPSMSVLPGRVDAWFTMTSKLRVANTAMSRTFDGAWWSVTLPLGWDGRPDKECATFQRNPPLGVLQISSARKDIGPVTAEDLREFAEERVASGVQLLEVSHGPFSGFSAEHSKEGRFWREWWLRSGQLTVYVTYNVAQGNARIEKDEVERIIESLKPTR